VIPFGIADTIYLPVSLTTSSAAGASGSLTFAMYPVGSWQNSANLPTGILYFINNYGGDNSMYSIDRFWRIEPANYVTKPALTNLTFTYLSNEYTAVGNNIIESNFIAQRYNKAFDSWDDYMPGTTVNTGTNTATVASLPSAELYTWWTLVDNRYILPVELMFFNAVCEDGRVAVTWQTATEQNNDYFVVERSPDAIHFDAVARVPSQNPNSVLPLSYEAADTMPYDGKSFYRLMQVDKDGKVTYSSIVMVKCSATDTVPSSVTIYPNPALDVLTVDMKGLKGEKMLYVYDLLGHEMLKFSASEDEHTRAAIQVSSFAKAGYVLRLDVNNEFYQVIKFIKE
jgi:hypothetical protein